MLAEKRPRKLFCIHPELLFRCYIRNMQIVHLWRMRRKFKQVSHSTGMRAGLFLRSASRCQLRGCITHRIIYVTIRSPLISTAGREWNEDDVERRLRCWASFRKVIIHCINWVTSKRIHCIFSDLSCEYFMNESLKTNLFPAMTQVNSTSAGRWQEARIKRKKWT